MRTLATNSVDIGLVGNSLDKMVAEIQLQTFDVTLKSLFERFSEVGISDKDCVVTGKSIGDIPSMYQIPALQSHEKPVVGTFVDRHIVPGFRYLVRVNGTSDYLFNRQPMILETIGIGYGKRLTFEAYDILRNDNFFWSDSAALGYGFSIQVLNTNSKYEVYEDDRLIGSCLVTSVAEEQNIIDSRNNYETSEHEKEVHVNFTALFSLSTQFSSQVVGLVKMTKGCREERANVKHIHALMVPTGTTSLVVSQGRKLQLRPSVEDH